MAHVPLADPVCPRLSAMAAAAARAAGVRVHDAATSLAMAGPQFSTRAESRLYRQWGAQVIGMTAMPEARLAREAELPYALVAMVTDYDSWREADDVDIASILRVMAANADAARTMVAGLVQALPGVRAVFMIEPAPSVTLITDPAVRRAGVVWRLEPLGRRVTGG
ncbi:hypothetical protein GCM10007973_17840 [Polymorphobacter multimanifer]|nr:hypothetical protein GCM10007973_17840 [Polymorphobacter multimanifer]